MTTDRLVQALVKERHFGFSSSSTGAVVECMHCGWIRRPRWRDHQRVFDLSCDHDCPGVETYAHMTARQEAERARDRAGKARYELNFGGSECISWFDLSESDRESFRRHAEQVPNAVALADDGAAS